MGRRLAPAEPFPIGAFVMVRCADLQRAGGIFGEGGDAHHCKHLQRAL
jgi:hypothetical protein